MKIFRELIANQDGAVAIEYTAMFAIMATTLLAAQSTLGGGITELWVDLVDQAAAAW